jgi:hypothetical protein
LCCLLGLLLLSLPFGKRVLCLSSHAGLPAASAVTTTTTTTTTTAVGLGACLIDVERTTIKVCSIQCFDGVAAGIVRHRDERETAGAASVSVSDNCDIFDVAVDSERGAEAVFAGIKAHVSYKDFQTISPNWKALLRIRDRAT